MEDLNDNYDYELIARANKLALYIENEGLSCEICGKAIDFLVDDVAYYCKHCDIVFHKECFEKKYGKDADLICPKCGIELEVASPSL